MTDGAIQFSIAIAAVLPMVAAITLALLAARKRRRQSEADTRARLMKLAAKFGYKADPTWPLATLACNVHSAVIAASMRTNVDAVLRQLRTVGDGDG